MNSITARFLAALLAAVVTLVVADIYIGILAANVGLAVLAFLLAEEVTDQVLSLRGGGE